MNPVILMVISGLFFTLGFIACTIAFPSQDSNLDWVEWNGFDIVCAGESKWAVIDAQGKTIGEGYSITTAIHHAQEQHGSRL